MNWPESKPSRRESQKKKKMQHRRGGSGVGGRIPRRATSDSSVAPSQPRRCFLDIQHPKYHLSKKKSVIIKTQQQTQQQINHVIKT